MISARILICSISLSLWNLGNQGFKTLPGSDGVYINILFNILPTSSMSDGCLSFQFESFCASYELLQSSRMLELREQRNMCYMFWIHILETIAQGVGQYQWPAVPQQARQCQMPLYMQGSGLSEELEQVVLDASGHDLLTGVLNSAFLSLWCFWMIQLRFGVWFFLIREIGKIRSF